MKIAIMGVGGVGGYFGGRLAAAGNAVHFLARGAHREAMARDGLRVLSPLGDLHIEDPLLPAAPAEVGVCEVVLFCVKLWSVEEAAAAIRPLVGPGTAIVPFQNGVVVADRLAERFGPAAVMGGVAQIATVIERPGVIRHSGTMARLYVGERDGRPSARAGALVEACGRAGIEAHLSEDIEGEIWRKFVLLAPLAGATTFYRCPVGALLADPERKARLAALIDEAVAVGRAKGVRLADDQETRTFGFIEGLPAGMKTSMQGDREQGRRLELEWLTGTIVTLGRALGVPTPENRAVYQALKPYASGKAG